jgi:hypothetical protein
MALKEQGQFPVDVAEGGFMNVYGSLRQFTREIGAFVSPTFLPAIMLLPDDARYAAYSLFVALHGKDIAAVC